MKHILLSTDRSSHTHAQTHRSFAQPEMDNSRVMVGWTDRISDQPWPSEIFAKWWQSPPCFVRVYYMCYYAVSGFCILLLTTRPVNAAVKVFSRFISAARRVLEGRLSPSLFWCLGCDVTPRAAQPYRATQSLPSSADGHMMKRPNNPWAGRIAG